MKTITKFVLVFVVILTPFFSTLGQTKYGFNGLVTNLASTVPVKYCRVSMSIRINGKIVKVIPPFFTDSIGRFSQPGIKIPGNSEVKIILSKSNYKDTTLTIHAANLNLFRMQENMFQIAQVATTAEIVREEKSFADNYQKLYDKFEKLRDILAKEKIKADKRLNREVQIFQVKMRGYEETIVKLKSDKDILNTQLADSLRSFNVEIIRMFKEFSELEAKANYYLEHLETFNVKIAGFQIQDGVQTPLRKQKQLKMKFFLEKVSKDFKVSKKPFQFKIRVQQIIDTRERKKNIGEDDFMYNATTMNTEKIIDMDSDEMSFSFDWVCDASKDQFFDDDRHYLVFLTNITNLDYILPLGHAQIFNGNKVTFYQEPNQEVKNPNLEKMIFEDRNITLCESKMQIEIANRVNFSDKDVVEIYVGGVRQVHTMNLKNSNSKYTFDIELGENSIEVLVKNNSGRARPMNKFNKVNFLIKFKGDCVQEEYRTGKEIELFPDQKSGFKVNRLK